MNITNPQQCLQQWEIDFRRTGDDSLIPEEDRERVLHEVDELYSLLYTTLVALGHTPRVDEGI